MNDEYSRRSKLAFLWVGFFVVVIVLLIALILYVDHRMGKVEQHFDDPEPMAHREPTLVDYPVTDVPKNVTMADKVYVPIYSHIYYDSGKPCLLEATLSIRNTDETRSLVVTSVNYFDTLGKLQKQHLDKPRLLKPLATMDFLVKRKDSKGGSGANFIVDWVAEEKISDPIIEAVMVGSLRSQMFSFARPGRTILRQEKTN